MEMSLFKLLSEKHSFAIAYLEHQYRMNSDIMSLSNTIIYKNRLKCGNLEVAQSFLNLNLTGLEILHPLPSSQSLQFGERSDCYSRKSCWWSDVLRPE